MKFFVKKYFKEEEVERAWELMKELAEKSVVEEGCKVYALHRDIDNPLAIVLLEEWDSLEDQKRHMQTEHFKRIVPLVGELAEKEDPITRFEEV